MAVKESPLGGGGSVLSFESCTNATKSPTRTGKFKRGNDI